MHLSESRRRVLVVAYYFPPMGGSGVQRVAKFAKYLPNYGWQPEVLTTRPGGYLAFDETLLDEMQAAGVRIHRTASWDPTRLFGAQEEVSLPAEETRQLLTTLSQCVFVPDNKIGWFVPAVRQGQELLRTGRFDAIFSSAPPYTAHLIAAYLSRHSGVSLVTDFRDDWVGNPRHVYPTPLHRWLHKYLERRVLRRSCHVFTTNAHMAQALRTRHPALKTPISALLHGFDAVDFEQPPAPRSPERMQFVYAGMFYDAQTPDFFLRALARLVQRRPEVRGRLEAVFVGLLPEASIQLARKLGIDGLIRHEGYVPHRQAVAHLKAADVLWLTVGRKPGAETILPGKLAEYVGARKPILGLVPGGAAKEALTSYGAARIVGPDDVEGIAQALEALYEAWMRGALPAPDEEAVRPFDRQRQAGVLARQLG